MLGGYMVDAFTVGCPVSGPVCMHVIGGTICYRSWYRPGLNFWNVFAAPDGSLSVEQKNPPFSLLREQ